MTTVEEERSPAAIATDDRRGESRPVRKAVLAVIVIATIARVIFSTLVGLEQDGVLSAEMARRFSWGYFDHPPLHYWLAALGESISTDYQPLLIRLPFILLGAGSAWLLFVLTALAFGERAGLWAVLGYSTCIYFTTLASINVAPDGPLFFFLVLAALLIGRIVLPATRPARPTLLWVLAGLALGAALISKYSAIFLPGGVFLFLVTARGRAKWLATPGPWLGLATACIVFSPVIYWNARHHWASFAFQAVRALPSADGGIDRVVESIVSQLGYLFPVFLVVLAIELLRALRAGPRSTNSWFFFCLAVPPIIVFTALNLFQRGLPHWTMSGWLFAFPLLGATVARFGVRGRVAAGWTVAVFGVLTIGIASLVAAHIRTAVVDRFSQKMLPLRGNAPDALLWSFLDWRDLRGALEERGFINGDTEFLVGFGDNAYRHLALAFDGEANVLCFCPSLQSQLRGTSDPSNFAGRMGIILYFPKEWNPALAGAAFERVEVLTPVQLVRDGVAVLEIGAARGYGLRPDALKGETGGS